MRAATLNGLAVADTVLIPVDGSSSYFALLGLNQLLQVVAAVRDAHKPDIIITQPSFPQPSTSEPPLKTPVARRENGSLPDSHETLAVNTGSTSRGPAFHHLMQTITAYTTITRNPWLQTDTVSYLQNHIDQVPVEKVKGVIQAVFDRADSRINSFAYYAASRIMPCTCVAGRRVALSAFE
jgi:hypothetical protein